MTDAHDDAPVDLLADRFELREILGRGGMATVWAANDTRLGRTVAVKILHDDLSAEHAQRIEREARAAGRIDDPRVVTVLDLDHTEDGTPFLVFEALSGRTLADEIQEHGALAPARVERLADDLLGALASAHRCGVLHRDIKPSNVLVDGEGFRITDFGIASIDDETATRGDLIGTLGYLAPERFDGAPASPQSDVFSAAAVLYEAVTGCQPFRAGTAVETIERLRSGVYEPLPADVSVRIRDEIVRGLDPDPADRAPDAVALTHPVAVTTAPAAVPGNADPTERLDATAHLAAPPRSGPPPSASARPEQQPSADLRDKIEEIRERPAVAESLERLRQPQTLFIGAGVLLLVLLLLAVVIDGGDGDGDDGPGDDPETQLEIQLERIEEIG